MSFWDTFLGNTDPGKIKDMMTSNPMLTKIQGLADDYTDFGSEYYQQGKDFFANTFNQQAMDQAWSTTRQQQEQLAATGQSGDSGGAIATMNQTFKDFGANAFNQTKKSLMDMWQAGQTIGAGYNQQATQIYADASSAAASQESQNNANAGSAIQNVIGIAAGALFGSDERIKKNISMDGNTRFAGYQVYNFEYKDPKAPGSSPGKQKGIMAQDVIKKDADMVHVNKDGHFMVDYQGLANRYGEK
tara:strand:+ start:3491 stop:4225 length:735 start_codon:yes stop_codon:yes gene_type:complete